jgi:carboxylesterase type B
VRGKKSFPSNFINPLDSWGESSGAISVSLQMLTNGGNTEGLFRAAFMESGSPIPVGDITNAQRYYDFIVGQTGCSGAVDTLQCLRGVDLATLKKAVDATPSLFSYQVC